MKTNKSPLVKDTRPHYGSVFNPKTGPGRVYAVLRRRFGHCVSNRVLQRDADTVAVSTQVSGANRQIEKYGQIIQTIYKFEKGKRRYYYRLITTGERGK